MLEGSLLLLPFFLLGYTVAVPLDPSSIEEASLFSPGSRFAVPGSLIPLQGSNNTTLSLSSHVSSNHSATPLSETARRAGIEWKAHITEGLWNIQAEEAPDAYLWTVESATAPYNSENFRAHLSTNVADLRFFYMTCYDPHNAEYPYVYSNGTLDPETRKVGWSKPRRIRNPGLPPPTELWWLPEHDIAEAAAVLGEPFRAITLQPQAFTSVDDVHQVYLFMKGVNVFAEVDAISLEILRWIPSLI